MGIRRAKPKRAVKPKRKARPKRKSPTKRYAVNTPLWPPSDEDDGYIPVDEPEWY